MTEADRDRELAREWIETWARTANYDGGIGSLAALLARVRREEREAAALMCEQHAALYVSREGDSGCPAGDRLSEHMQGLCGCGATAWEFRSLAASIRARGATPEEGRL